MAEVELDPHLIDESTEIDKNKVYKDLFAGTCGGIAQVLSGQPFDTTKVRLQSAPEGTYSGAMDVVKKLLKTDGPLGFYKGTLTPLVGVGACVSIQFGVNQAMQRFFQARNKPGQGLSNGQFYLAGMAAGIANGILASPIEHVRIRLQTQVGNVYAGPADAIRKMYSSSGVSGIFRGITPTLIREGHGMGAYFLAYEALVANEGVPRTQIPGWKLCMFGAAAGYAMWFTSYPIDVVKSKMQTDSLLKSERLYNSTLDCIVKVWKANGIRGFFRGFLPTILRAAPVNACTFYTFELVSRQLG